VVTGGSPDQELTYKGKTYYVCCGTCRKEFMADPEKALAGARKEGWIKE
jgi:YHS domain-containing protein